MYGVSVCVCVFWTILYRTIMANRNIRNITLNGHVEIVDSSPRNGLTRIRRAGGLGIQCKEDHHSGYL